MQAKNWIGKVGINEIQRFKGSLNDVLANKGIFITSGHFSKPAIKSARKGTIRTSLIDGEKLVNIMIEYNIGVLSKEYKLIDEKFFKHLEELTYKEKEENKVFEETTKKQGIFKYLN